MAFPAGVIRFQHTSVEHRGLQWNSPTVSSALHTVELIHASRTRGLDGLIILNDVPVTPTITPTGTVTQTATTIPPRLHLFHPTLITLYITEISAPKLRLIAGRLAMRRKIDSGTGTVYIRIYIDNILRSGKYTVKGGRISILTCSPCPVTASRPDRITTSP